MWERYFTSPCSGQTRRNVPWTSVVDSVEKLLILMSNFGSSRQFHLQNVPHQLPKYPKIMELFL